MKTTKKGTLKKDITATLVIRPRVLQSKSKSKRRLGTA